MTTRIPITDVRPDPKQPRVFFRESALKALATSIKKNGQRMPISVRRRRAGANPPYEIIDGERRWRACHLAGIATIRIDIEVADLSRHATQHRLSIVSNFMREGHTHMEISGAVCYQITAAVEAGESRGQAVLSLAEDLGKSDQWVYSYLKLQELDPGLQERMHPDVPSAKRLRFTVAVVLASCPAEKQKAIYRKLLSLPESSRLGAARRLVEEVTGVPRLRERPSIKRDVDRFVSRLSADIDRVLEYKQSDFQRTLEQLPKAELKAFRIRLATCSEQVVFLVDAINRAIGQKG